MDASLKKKVIACLDMIEENLPGAGSSAKKKAVVEEPPKRKRGRPRKNPLPVESPKAAAKGKTKKDKWVPDYYSSEDEEEDYEEEEVPKKLPAKKRGPGRPRKSESAKKKPKRTVVHEEDSSDEEDVVASSPRNGRRAPATGATLSALIAQFEEQYKVVGKAYKEMGQTLTALKTKVQANRQEIKDELLQEVQRTLVTSFDGRN